jgi:NADPH:quinone reductase-like Zn-dependent oxidoreductase
MIVAPARHLAKESLVIGCGGVGLSVIQGARIAGASRIIAVDLRREKAEVAVALGATDIVDASAVDAIEAVRDLVPDGIDYAFDAIGHTTTTEQAIEMLGLGGAAVIVGLPATGARASFEPLALAHGSPAERQSRSQQTHIMKKIEVLQLESDDFRAMEGKTLQWEWLKPDVHEAALKADFILLLGRIYRNHEGSALIEMESLVREIESRTMRMRPKSQWNAEAVATASTEASNT